jgi:arylsulfatase
MKTTHSLLLGIGALSLFACEKKQETKPNIILILTDDQGYGDISAHGSPDVVTPNMDKLKSQSLSLENFHVSPTSAPTRSALLTGRHPFKNGITHTILERERMTLSAKTLPEVLKRKNYSTGIFGKWHLGDEKPYQPENRGFDEVFIHGGGGIGQSYTGSCADTPNNNYHDPIFKHNNKYVKTSGFCTDVIFSQALSWIKKKSQDTEPFFAYVATNAPHGPFIAPDKYKKKFIDQGYPEKAQGFYGMIENIDDNLGVLMQKLDEWELSENTILIFMTDNGITWVGYNTIHGETYNAGMRGFKGSVWEGGVRVPFFIRWPKKIKAGTKSSCQLNHYDFLPTIAEMVGADISEIDKIDGLSFFPTLQGEMQKLDRIRVFHGGRWGLNPENCNGYKVRKNFVGTAESCKPENSKFKNCAIRDNQYKMINGKELYDLINDPKEVKNIFDLHPTVVSKLQKEYDKWWNDIQQYLINENIPLSKTKPFWEEYYKQEKKEGIPLLEQPKL